MDSRGLLQWDRRANVYDLHPVVRSYAIGSVSPTEKKESAKRVVDYFSSKPDRSLENATGLNDLRNQLQVARTLCHGGDLVELQGRLKLLYPALLHKLDEQFELLALLRPFFPKGWLAPPVQMKKCRCRVGCEYCFDRLPLHWEVRCGPGD